MILINDPQRVLVIDAEKYAQTRHPLGLAITVARRQSKTASELSFLTTVHTAKGLSGRVLPSRRAFLRFSPANSFTVRRPTG